MNKVERDQHRRDMKHPRTRIRRVLTAPLMDGEVSIAAEHKKWHDAFGAVVAGILAGKHHMKRHSDGETPWQFALADYRVLFSDKTPRGTESMNRPQAVTKRDLLVGVLACTAVQLKMPAALDVAAEACSPLFEDYAPDPKRWYPIIDVPHAQAAIKYAGRALRFGAINQEEYIWICEKARMAILKPPRAESAVAIIRPLHERARLLLRDEGPYDAA